MLTRPRSAKQQRMYLKCGAHYVERHAFAYVVGELKLYRQRLRDLDAAKEAVALAPHVPTGMPGSPSPGAHDDTFTKFQALARDQEIIELTEKTEPITRLLHELRGPREGSREKKRRLLHMLYIDETHQLKGAAMELGIGEEWARQLSREAVWMVGVALGVF